MKKIIISAACAVMLFASSCSTSKYTEARSITTNDAEIFTMPVVANLNVEAQRKTWNVTIKRKDAIAMGLNVNNMRAFAIAVACRDGNPDSNPIYDAIVGPIYTVKSSGKRYDVQVTGFPATYSSFKNLEHDDIELLKFSGQGTSELVPVSTDEVSKFHLFKK